MEPIVEEKDMVIPHATCAGCGTQENVKVFGLKTYPYSPTAQQLIPYCQRCTLVIMRMFIKAWAPDASPLHDPMLYALDSLLEE